MTIRTLFSLILGLMMFSACWAQQHENVSFETPAVGLGTIVDNQGMVNHRFQFTNFTAEPVLVEKVATSCGCTSSNWSTDAVNPGDNGYVEIQFDPFNRPGPFEKTAFVYYKGRSDSVKLTIRGFVAPGAESIADNYPIEMGALRVKEKLFDLGTITKRSLHSKSFEVYNSSNQILVFADDMFGPNHITVTFEPYTLRPRTTGKIWVHYDVKAKNDLGFFSEDIAIFTYESKDTRKDFTVTATLLDIPAKNNPKAPKVSFNKTEIDFGIKQQGDTVNVQFTLQNRGESKLRVKKVFGNCNCIRVALEKQELDPGELATLSVVFLTYQRLGNQEKSITIFTDDPDQPVALLKLKGRLRGPRN